MSASAASPPAATPDDVRKRRPASSSSKTHRARGCQKTAGPAVWGWPCAIARLFDVARRPFSAPAAARSQDPVHTEKMTRGFACLDAFLSQEPNSTAIEEEDVEEDREVSSIAPQDHPLLTGENDSENEHAPSPTDVFATEAYEGSPKKKQRVA